MKSTIAIPALLSVLPLAVLAGACRLTEPVCHAIVQEVVDLRGDTVVTASGVRYVVLRPGAGAPVEACDPVGIRYDAYLLDGEHVDFHHGGEPYFLTPGENRVLPGLEEGVLGMQQDELRRVIIPPELAYGEAGAGPIPPGATLVVDVSLVRGPHRWADPVPP
jgi:FKBP-type peptidyl-prolyl cis-trans isomerase